MPEDSGMPHEGNGPPLFDFAGENTELINATGFYGAGHLNRLGLGPPNHPTIPAASADTSYSTTLQADFSVPVFQARVRSGDSSGTLLSASINSKQTFQQQPGLSTVTATYTSYQQQQQQQQHPATSPVIGADWHDQQQSYNSNGAPALSSFSCASYAAQQTNTDPYMGDYVSAPQTVQQDWLNITPQQPDFGYNLCSASGDGGCDVIMSSMALSPSSAGSLASPTFPPTGGFPEQPLVYGGQDENGYSSSQQRQPTDTVAALSSAGSFAPPRPPAASSKHPKLRSASRTSKNVQPRPDETPRERKSRNSHNLVEKQYRNRLNLQFESLMNALPESMRNSAASGGGDGATSERLELGERRLSKAQVLDMSTRYIKTLESDREALERENGELVKGIEILKDLLDKEVRDSDSCIPDIGNVGRGERR